MCIRDRYLIDQPVHLVDAAAAVVRGNQRDPAVRFVTALRLQQHHRHLETLKPTPAAQPQDRRQRLEMERFPGLQQHAVMDDQLERRIISRLFKVVRQAIVQAFFFGFFQLLTSGFLVIAAARCV